MCAWRTEGRRSRHGAWVLNLTQINETHMPGEQFRDERQLAAAVFPRKEDSHEAGCSWRHGNARPAPKGAPQRFLVALLALLLPAPLVSITVVRTTRPPASLRRLTQPGLGRAVSREAPRTWEIASREFRMKP